MSATPAEPLLSAASGMSAMDVAVDTRAVHASVRSTNRRHGATQYVSFFTAILLLGTKRGTKIGVRESEIGEPFGGINAERDRKQCCASSERDHAGGRAGKRRDYHRPNQRASQAQERPAAIHPTVSFHECAQGGRQVASLLNRNAQLFREILRIRWTISRRLRQTPRHQARKLSRNRHAAVRKLRHRGHDLLREHFLRGVRLKRQATRQHIERGGTEGVEVTPSVNFATQRLLGTHEFRSARYMVVG